MEKLLVKPAPGRLVRDPATMTPLPAEGAEVVLDAFWRRRIAAGDVITAAPAAKKAGGK